MDSLDLKYAKSVLLRVADRGAVKKSDLFDVVKSHQVLDNLLGALMKDEYLKIEENKRGPKKYSIFLTPKGKIVAKKLKEADKLASGRSVPRETVEVEIPEGIYEQILRILRLDKEERSVEEFVLNAIKERIKDWKNRNEEIEGHP